MSLKIFKAMKLNTIVFLAALTLFASSMQAQIKVSTDINAMCTSGETLYVAASTRVFVVTGNGADWKALPAKGLENVRIMSIAVYDGTIFLGTLDDGVFISNDNGSTWTASNTGIKHSGTFYHTVNAFTKVGSKIYLGSNSGQGMKDKSALYVSGDMGKTWAVIPEILKKESIKSLQTDGKNIFAYSLYNSTVSRLNGEPGNFQEFPEDRFKQKGYVITDKIIYKGDYFGVYTSADNGVNWSSFGKPLSGVSDILVIGSKIYAIAKDKQNVKESYGGSGTVVYVSDINEPEWLYAQDALMTIKAHTKPEIKINHNVSAVGMEGETFYIADVDGLFRVTESGYSWTRLEGSGLKDVQLTSILPNGNKIFAGTYQGGIYRSEDAGRSLQAFNAGLPASYLVSNITALAQIGKDIYASVLGPEIKKSGLYVLKEGSESWTKVKTELNDHFIYQFKADGAMLFASTSGYDYIVDPVTGIIQSDLAGFKKKDCYAISGDRTYYAKEKDVFKGENKPEGVYLSTDNRKTWNLFGEPFGEVKKIFLVGNTLFALAWKKGEGGTALYATSIDKPKWVTANRYLQTTPIYTALQNYYKAAAEIEYANFPAAVLKLDESIRIRPGFSEAYSLRADCYNKMKEFDKEKSDRLTAVKLKSMPGGGDSLLFRNLFERMKEEMSDKGSWLYVDCYYKDEAAILKKANLTAGKESIYCYDKLVAANNKNDNYLLKRGHVHLKMENFEAALADYNAAAALNPKNPRYELIETVEEGSQDCAYCEGGFIIEEVKGFQNAYDNSYKMVKVRRACSRCSNGYVTYKRNVKSLKAKN